MPVNMTLRLLSAAQQAYAIKGDGPVPNFGTGPNAPSSACVGYTTQPIGVRAGLFNQDAGFVATLAEGAVVSIRGTTPPQSNQDVRQVIVDWASDAVAILEPPGGTPPGFPGKVHFGFYTSFMQLWGKLGPRVKSAVLGQAQKTIFVTGHSKGGAICALVAWRLHLDYPGYKIVVRAFAPARVGDGTFASAYNARVPDHVRYEFDDDIVPHMPLQTALIAALGAPPLAAILLSNVDPGYGSVGTLGYIRADNSIVPESAGLDADRLSRLIARLETSDGPSYVVSCHGIDKANDGYVRAHFPS